MVDVFVRSIEGFLMAESWTSNQAQVRVDEYFTAPRQVQSRGRKEILQELNLKSKKTLAKFVSFALPKPRFDFSTNFVSSFHVNFQRKFFFLSDICSIDFIFPAKNMGRLKYACASFFFFIARKCYFSRRKNKGAQNKHAPIIFFFSSDI